MQGGSVLDYAGPNKCACVFRCVCFFDCGLCVYAWSILVSARVLNFYLNLFRDHMYDMMRVCCEFMHSAFET